MELSAGLYGLIGSVIVAVLTLVGIIYQSRKNNDTLFNKLDAKLEVYQAVTDEKVSELTREVRAHNNHQERISLLEAESNRTNERLKLLENRTA